MKLNVKKGEKTKKIAAKKASLEKEATMEIQAMFEEPLGRGLRCFIPEPQKVQRATGPAHPTVYMLHCTPYTALYTAYLTLHCTMHTLHCTAYTALYTAHLTLHFTLHTLHCTP